MEEIGLKRESAINNTLATMYKWMYIKSMTFESAEDYRVAFSKKLEEELKRMVMSLP